MATHKDDKSIMSQRKRGLMFVCYQLKNKNGKRKEAEEKKKKLKERAVASFEY